MSKNDENGLNTCLKNEHKVDDVEYMAGFKTI